MTLASNRTYTIVTGIDYSELGDLAVAQAFALAKGQPRSEIHFVNVARTAGVGVFVDDKAGVLTMSLDEAAEKVRRYAEGKVAELTDAGGLQRVVTHVALGAPAEQLAQLASDLESDMLVVGTHGRRGVERLLLGSVAEGVVRMASCPVLVVRGKEPESRVPEIAPPCPRCIEVRRASAGKDIWCAQHSERHPRPHTYHYVPRNVAAAAHSNMPLVEPMSRE
ncbi:MAG: universal stress protein [Polyangiaceae bacterium]|nr:universal stress protein [Polyangiaceae bacterium]